MILKYARASCSTKVCPQEPNLLGFYQSPTDLGKEKYPSPADSSLEEGQYLTLAPSTLS